MAILVCGVCVVRKVRSTLHVCVCGTYGTLSYMVLRKITTSCGCHVASCAATMNVCCSSWGATPESGWKRHWMRTRDSCRSTNREFDVRSICFMICKHTHSFLALTRYITPLCVCLSMLNFLKVPMSKKDLRLTTEKQPAVASQSVVPYCEPLNTEPWTLESWIMYNFALNLRSCWSNCQLSSLSLTKWRLRGTFGKAFLKSH